MLALLEIEDTKIPKTKIIEIAKISVRKVIPQRSF